MADTPDTDRLRWCILIDGKVYLECPYREPERAKARASILSRESSEWRVELKLMRLVEVEQEQGEG